MFQTFPWCWCCCGFFFCYNVTYEGEILSDTNQKADFVAWILRDVKKESVAELEASYLPWSQVEGLLRKKADAWFQKEYNKTKSSSPLKKSASSSLSSSSNSYTSLLLRSFDDEYDNSNNYNEEREEESSMKNFDTTLFDGLCFAFSEGIGFAKKSELTKAIKERGGEVSYILSNKKCTHLIAIRDEVIAGSSSKIIAAKKIVEERSSGNGLPTYSKKSCVWFWLWCCV